MTVYADASVISAVIFDEPEPERARDFLRRTRERVIVTDLARLEFAAVVSRLLRTGKFNGDQSARALAGFDMLYAACLPVTHGPRDFAFAEELVRDFSTKLVAPDACNWRARGRPAHRSRPSTRGSPPRRGSMRWAWWSWGSPSSRIRLWIT